MSLSFMQPFFLWGTLLGLLPIIIHLINRRRHRLHEFAAISFVLRSKTRHARKFKLKKFLLLLFRTLLCLAIPLALSRPYIDTGTGTDEEARGDGPSAVAIIMDRSLSMNYIMGGKTLFEHAQSHARDILSSLSVEDAVAVLPCDFSHKGPLPGTSYDTAEIRRQIFDAAPGYGRADMMNCISDAVRIVADSPLQSRRIYVITDLTASAWRLDSPVPMISTEEGEKRPHIVVVDAANGRSMPNRWISDLSVEPAMALGSRGYAFTMTVRSSGGASGENLSALLYHDDNPLIRGFIDLPENGTVMRTLSHRFLEGGEITGRVEIEKDNLAIDDSLHFIMQAQPDLRALVVDGNPGLSRFEEEVFFVERALFPGRGAPSTIRPRSVDTDGFTRTDLSSYDLVLLLNLNSVPPKKADELIDFVENGGGLFISSGPNMDPDAFNRTLGVLLPAVIHIPKEADAGKTAFSAIAWEHPVFSVFSGTGREGFVSARFSRYMLTMPPRPDTEVLAAYDDGAPAIMIRPYGRGRVALYTSTVTREWSDFPIRTSFLPTIQQLAGYLSHSLEEREHQSIMVGESMTLDIPPGADELRVIPPSDNHAVFRGDDLAEGRLRYTDTYVPGIYTVKMRRGQNEPVRAPGLSFVVRTDPVESDTRRLEPSELETHLGGRVSEGRRVHVSGGNGPTRPLWSILLLIAVFAIIAEGFLLR